MLGGSYILEDENKTIKDFIISEALGRGAFSEYPDKESFDGKTFIPFTPNVLKYKEMLSEIQKELNEAYAMTDEEIEDDIEKTYNKTINEIKLHEKNRLKQLSAVNQKYEEFKKWKSPSSDHDNLYNSVLSSLEKEIKGLEYSSLKNKDKEVTKSTVEVTRYTIIKYAHYRLNKVIEDFEQECKYCRERNEWISKLCDSLRVFDK